MLKDWVSMNEERPLTPEVKLWRAVLEMAYHDAESSSGKFSRVMARHFLCATVEMMDSDLRSLCRKAGIPASRVIRFARNRYGLRPQEAA